MKAKIEMTLGLVATVAIGTSMVTAFWLITYASAITVALNGGGLNATLIYIACMLLLSVMIFICYCGFDEVREDVRAYRRRR